jgi:hypothetical protein
MRLARACPCHSDGKAMLERIAAMLVELAKAQEE